MKSFYEEMERLGVIKVEKTAGTSVAWSFNESFKDELDQRVSEERHFTMTDDTVDPDAVILLGVMKMIHLKLKGRASAKKMGYCSALVFEALMKVEYGSPLPAQKRFDSMLKELGEATSVPFRVNN
ncbi:MAG: hypothetical protein JRM77_05360 [Nitrososphaerota archaeon]|jgi:hypothetical protein|nr:hypothetical protein [Nitrososphaerota archaeon]